MKFINGNFITLFPSSFCIICNRAQASPKMRAQQGVLLFTFKRIPLISSQWCNLTDNLMNFLSLLWWFDVWKFQIDSLSIVYFYYFFFTQNVFDTKRITPIWQLFYSTKFVDHTKYGFLYYFLFKSPVEW